MKKFWDPKGPDYVALVLLGVVVAWFNFPRAPIPFKEVEGTYLNPCCNAVYLRDGAFYFGSEHVPLKLANMKFGLVAEVDRQIIIDSGHQVKSIDSTNPYGEMIVFDDDHRGFNLGDGVSEIYHFTRQ